MHGQQNIKKKLDIIFRKPPEKVFPNLKQNFTETCCS